MSNSLVGRSILISGFLALTAGKSLADVDCSSIIACTLPTIPAPDRYDPAVQMVVMGSISGEGDLFLDGSCSALFDTASFDGTLSGLTTFGYSLDPPMNPGDVISWKLRIAGCPETACLTAVAETDVCPGF